MVTRFYLHDTANSTTGLPTAKQSAQTTSGTGGSVSVNKQMNITKGVAQTFVSTTSGAGYTYFTRFVSDALAAQTIAAATWTINFAVSESSASGSSNTRVCIYVWRPSTTTKIGNVFDATVALSNPFSAAEVSQNVTASGSAVTCLASDVLCYEAICDTFGSGTTLKYYYDGATITTTAGTTVSAHASFIENPNTISFPTAVIDATSTTISNLTNKFITKI